MSNLFCAGFANEAQFLLVNAASVADVARRLAAKQQPDAGPRTAALTPAAAAGEQPHASPLGAIKLDRAAAAFAAEVARFRPNILIGGGGGLAPFEEDGWRRVQLGASSFSVDGGCSTLQCRAHNLSMAFLHMVNSCLSSHCLLSVYCNPVVQPTALSFLYFLL